MDVFVERFQRRRIVSDKSSPMLYYLRQKPKTCGTVDIDVPAASIQKNCAMTKGDVKHVIEALVEDSGAPCQRRQGEAGTSLGTLHMTFRCPGVEKFGRLHGEEYSSEYPLCARQGAEACERQYGCHPQPGKRGFRWTSLRTAVLPVVAAV